MLIPGPFDLGPARADDIGEAAQRAGVEPGAARHAYLRRQPEFRFRPGAHDMDMDRLARVALVRVEEEAEPVLSEHRGHGAG